MAVRSLGPGTLWAVPAGGSPLKFGTLQDVSVDIKIANALLYGAGIFPEEIGHGKGTIALKAKMGRIQASVLALLTGTSATGGSTAAAIDEAGSIPGSTSYIVTVANSATFTQDLGVRYKSNGLPFQEVASAPAVGQYSVAAGVYTFAAADHGVAVLICYAYTVSGSGQTMAVSNPLQGMQTTFMVTVQTQFKGKDGTVRSAVLTLNSCVSGSFNFATKMGDFAVPEFDCDAQQDEAGNVFSWAFSEVT